MPEVRDGAVWMRREEARDNILAKAVFDPQTETISVAPAAARICAEELRAQFDLPVLNASRVDGVVVRYADFENGIPDTSGWVEGRDFERTNTCIGFEGAFDTGVKVEELEFDEAGRITFKTRPAAKGAYLVPAGSQLKKGAVVARMGQRINPMEAARIASGGYSEVKVYRKPRVAFIPTGNELVEAGEELTPKHNIETNSIMMAGKLEAWGAEMLRYPILRDDPDLIEETLRDALGKADIVVLNGGSSMGTEDYAIEALSRVGTVLNHGVLMGPGARTSFTVAADGTPIMGLSGPSGGAESTADWYVKPLIDAYYGLPFQAPPVIKAHISAPLSSSSKPGSSNVKGAKRMRIARDADGCFIATPLVDPYGGEKNDEVGGNGFLFVSAGDDFAAGDEVEVELRYPYTVPPSIR